LAWSSKWPGIEKERIKGETMVLTRNAAIQMPKDELFELNSYVVHFNYVSAALSPGPAIAAEDRIRFPATTYKKRYNSQSFFNM
jgi:hypothetical protein